MIPRLWLFVILGAVLVGALTGAYFLGRNREADAQAAELLKANQRAQKLETDLRQKTREIDLDDRVKESALDQRLVVQLSAPQPLWLCDAADTGKPADPAPAAGSDAARDAGHVLPPRDDLAPALLVYGRDCERIRQKLTALQAWADTVTAH